MAYAQNNNRTPYRSNSGGSTPQAGTSTPVGKKEFVEDPNRVGIGYEKQSEKAGTYFSFTVLKDIPAGSKVAVYTNKTKTRTDKTPTHILKLTPPRK